MQVIKVKRRCPFCFKKELIKAGRYFVHCKPHYHQRYSCKNCGKRFNHNVLMGRYRVRKWDNKIQKRVIKLINETGHYTSRHDTRIDKNYLSSRAIVKKIKSKFHKKISKSTVHIMIKKFRITDKDTNRNIY